MISIVVLIFIISVIRFLSVFDTVKTNLEIIFRPGIKVLSVCLSSKIIFALIAIFALIYFVRILRKTDSKIKNSYFFLLLIFYIVSGLSQRNVYQNYSYLYVFQKLNVKFDVILPFLEQDLFFEEPYIFWFILLIGIVFFILKKKNLQEYAIPLWIIPFCFLDFPLNSLLVLYGITILAIAIFGMKYGKRNSSVYYYLFQFIINIFIVIYAFYSSVYDDKILMLYFLEILSIYFVPSFALLLYCIKKNKEETIASTWAIPAFTFLLVTLPLTKSSLLKSLSISSSIMNSFLYLGNISILVSLILFISFVIGKINTKLKKISFWLLSLLTIAYYALDSLLYHYSHFRINQQTLAWTMNMDDIVGTTLKTCLNYVNLETWLIVIVALIVIPLIIKNSNKILKKGSSLSFFCIIIVLSSQISSFLLPIITELPLQTLQDPFYTALKEINLTTKRISLSEKEIEAGFKECKTPIKIYENSEPAIKGNGFNCILVTLESVHWRYLDMFCEEQKTWPNMSKYKDRMEIFPYFFSCFPESTLGDIAMVSGLQIYSPNFIFKKDSLFCPTLVNDLKKHNYSTYLFSSESLIDGNLISIVKTMNFDSVLSYTSSMVDNKNDYWYWGIKEEKNVNNIIDAVTKRNNDNPYFVWYRTVYPHAPFTSFDKPQDLVFKKENIMAKDKVVDYKNCLIYLDKQLAKLVEKIDELDRKNNKKTIIFLVADHGEMLGEKDNFGLYGHGSYAQSKLTNCPYIIIYPDEKGFKVNKKPSSQIDVLPTILDCLNIKPSVKRFEFGESLINNMDNNRPIYLSSSKSYGLVEDGYYYYFIDRNSPECIVEKMDIDNNFKATFEKIETVDEDKILEKYNRIKKYFELQEAFISRY